MKRWMFVVVLLGVIVSTLLPPMQKVEANTTPPAGMCEVLLYSSVADCGPQQFYYSHPDPWIQLEFISIEISNVVYCANSPDPDMRAVLTARLSGGMGPCENAAVVPVFDENDERITVLMPCDFMNRIDMQCRVVVDIQPDCCFGDIEGDCCEFDADF